MKTQTEPAPAQPSSVPIRFGAFVLDAAEGRLVRGAEVLPLRRRSFAVLHYLALRPGRLVTKAELFAAVWPDVTVSEIVLAVCISELRKALDDSAKIPRFIETVHGRGYRFIGEVGGERAPDGATPTSVATLPIVGRDAELARLGHHLDLALAGQRQIVFVTGDAGIGKTTVVEAFLDGMAVKGPFWIARGQCVELASLLGHPFGIEHGEITERVGERFADARLLGEGFHAEDDARSEIVLFVRRDPLDFGLR